LCPDNGSGKSGCRYYLEVYMYAKQHILLVQLR
jgi:hypothetical protein